MSLRRPARALAVIAMAITAVAVFAAPAQAGTDATVYPFVNPGGGVVTFQDNGDVVTVCDTDADGKRAAVYVYQYNPGVGWLPTYRTYAAGNGNCTTRSASDGYPYNLAEGEYYKIKICLGTTETGNPTCNWANVYA